jgi:RNA polymerase sigma-70 factor (ECF subfamily)
MTESIDPENDSRQLLPEVFSRYGKVLARAIARLVKPHDVEDVVQETYMRVFQAARKQPIRSPRAFMLKTARNIALNKLTWADALNHMIDPPEDNQEGDAGLGDLSVERGMEEMTPDSVLESEQEFAVFCRAVRGLPRQCRRAFLLRKVYGLSQREVAQRLGVSEGTVEKHIAKGMLECVRYMQAHGLMHPAKTAARKSGVSR